MTTVKLAIRLAKKTLIFVKQIATYRSSVGWAQGKSATENNRREARREKEKERGAGFFEHFDRKKTADNETFY